MDPHAKGFIEIEAELRALNTSAQLVHYHFLEPPNSKLLEQDKFRVELCLTSRHRGSRACYRDHWSSHRFERIGDLFLIPPSTVLLVKSEEITPITSIVCQIEPKLIYTSFDKYPELIDQYLEASLDIKNATLRRMLLRLAEEIRHPGFASEMLVESLAVQMAIELIRYGHSINEQRVKGGLAPWQLRRIDERLQEVCSAPSLSELAELCRVSTRQLSRAFRASRGCSIGSYVTNSQMEHAKRLLATDESITHIAHTLGFSFSSDFCFAFRRSLGLTPGQYRARLLRVQ